MFNGTSLSLNSDTVTSDNHVYHVREKSIEIIGDLIYEPI